MNTSFWTHKKLVIFDFDGTLVDSNPIKLSAFDTVFADQAVLLPQILKYCHANHHTPRAVKFRHVYESILNRPYSPEIEADLLSRYSKATTQAVIDAPEIAGALDFVKAAATRRPTALLSSTPTDVLNEILAKRGWAPYFSHVQGAPVKKGAWIARLAASLGVFSHEVIFFGDTWEDAASAREAGCAFVAVGNTDLKKQETYIPNFLDLGAVL